MMTGRPLHNLNRNQSAINSVKLQEDINNRTSFTNKKPNTFTLDKLCNDFVKDYKKSETPSAIRTSQVQASTSGIQQEKNQAPTLTDWRLVSNTSKKRKMDQTNSSPPVTTNNRFNALSEAMEFSDNTDNNAGAGENSTTVTSKETRPPPINTYNVNIKKIIEVLKNNVNANHYNIKNNIDNNHIIYTSNLESYNKIKQKLTDSAIKFYTYTPKNLQKKNLVLKGLNSAYDPKEILDELTSFKISNVTILKVEKMQSRKKPPDEDTQVNYTSNYIVQLSNDSDIKGIFSVRSLFQQIIYWENLR